MIPLRRAPAPPDASAPAGAAPSPPRARRRRLGTSRASGSPLAGVAPFDRYPARRLRALAAHADRVQVPEGTVLAREGGLVHELVVVVAGEVVATRTGGDSRAPASEDRLGAGARFGSLELVAGSPHPATLVAGPGLEVLVVNGPAYRGAAQVLPGLAVA